MTCVAPGWGSGIWGTSPWGGSLLPDVGGPLPTVPPFDIYCVGPCGPISTILTHPEVVTIGDGSQFPLDGALDQCLASGGSYETTDAAMEINVSVPENFTFEFTVSFADLPPSFSSITDSHAYFGTWCPSAGCVGLFFSQIGIAYTGSVHLDGGNNLVLDTPVQPLENSQTLVGINEYWTVRIAVSFTTGAVFIYVTLTSELLTIGHQLRWIMPIIPSSSAAITPPSETFVSVRGTASNETLAAINSICLGTGVIIPAIPPVAEAGFDQAIQLCTILQLDGSASYDPQGATLTYLWQLIDAPLSSQYIYNETDGLTYPGTPPTGFTDRLYSVSLEAINVAAPIAVGDVFVLQGQVHTVSGTGLDIDGFFIRAEGFVLPDSFSSPTAFTYLPQYGLNTSTSQKPTFYPDVPGIFSFQLVVFDGTLYSEPSPVLVNVLESFVARGCVPDLSFVWNYLSDFWNLVEGTERITTFWQGMAQVAAAELLRLWQVDYNKSLGNIQRTFQRRWLNYNLLMQENPAVQSLSTVTAIFSGVESVVVPNNSITGIQGTHLDLQFSTLPGATVFNFPGQDPYSATKLAALMQAALMQIDPSIQVHVLRNRNGTESILRIDAPYAFTVLSTSTCPIFNVGASNGAPTGNHGVGLVSTNTYRCNHSLQYLAIPPSSFLCIDGVGYRIARVVDDPSDDYPFQRVVLLDALPTPSDKVWSIAGTVTSEDLDFWNGLCEVSDLVIYQVVNNATQAVTPVMGPALGSCEEITSSLPVDASVVGQYLAQPAVYTVTLSGVLRRQYMPLDPLIVDVPFLQEFIQSTDDTQVLRRNVDYFIDSFRGQQCLRFITPVPSNAGGNDVWQGQSPPPQLWAETSYLDNRPSIEANFGIPANFTLADLAQLPPNVDYLSAVQGLWYAYWNGPTVFNMRAGLQILLGLPFAEQTGVIQSIRDDFSVTQGQILVQDTANALIVREYNYPPSLPLEVNPATGLPYAVGDTVQQFAPMVQGVELADYVNTPTWFGGYLSQGAFFEVEKYFKFLVRIDAAAFNLAALLYAKSFVLRIKPTYTYPLFVVLEQLGTTGDTTVTTSDEVLLSGTLNLFAGACFSDSDPTVIAGTVPTDSASLYGIGGGLDGTTLAMDVDGVSGLSMTFAGASSSASQSAMLAAVAAAFPVLSAFLGGDDGQCLALSANASIVINAGTANAVLGLTTGVYRGGNVRGVATMFDQPNPAGGGWRNQFDAGPDLDDPPVYPTPRMPIIWAFDKNYLCPEDVITGTACTTFSSPTMPYFDGGIFAFDSPVYTQELALFGSGTVAELPPPPGLPIGPPVYSTASGTVTEIGLEINAILAGNPNTFHLVILKNGSTVATVAFTLTDGGFTLSTGASIAVSIGDELSCFIVSTTGLALDVLWTDILVTLGAGVFWSFDTTLSAGTYCAYKPL